MEIFLIYLLLVNVISFSMYGIDKWKAKNKSWRIPEWQLIFIAIIGGSIGAVLGMKIFHHKTHHNKFGIGLPVILIIQTAIVLYVLHIYNFI